MKVRCRAPVARQAHNLEVGGSIPPGATSESMTATPGVAVVVSKASNPGRGLPREIDPPAISRSAPSTARTCPAASSRAARTSSSRTVFRGKVTATLAPAALKIRVEPRAGGPPLPFAFEAPARAGLPDGLADDLGGGVAGQVLVDDPPGDLALDGAVLDLGDLVGGGRRDRPVVDLPLELGREGQERERLADRPLADVELAGEFLGGPAVEVHELAVGPGLLDRLEVLAEQVLDDLFLEDLRGAQAVVGEDAGHRLEAGPESPPGSGARRR